MLLVFHSEPAQDVMMLSSHALPVLQATGRDYSDGVPERGAFSAEQLPAAIAGIERAIAEGEPVTPFGDEHDADHKPAAMDQAVNFHQRAYPLLDMMRLALAQGKSVMWEPASNW
ncbi:DUF1840 domain-containing protein [Paracandidimonas soli]|jgi:hypothetical protein|uniref:Uncharacterized protein DUF1840 n=1 Tax=Paracandidimonas soli TaxID=1917182 RepID=A0A4R3VG21_9BURK|nr:DUF1840 domain-containing protein [Paracandidimonas soli]TCV02678.1 uncharacterized protein DUF1840 [Paracandidimonas soli]